jgi:NitT/TauT family transport system permease protein
MAKPDAARLSTLRAVSAALPVLLWWAWALLAANPRLLPGPGAVLRFAWDELARGALASNFAATFARVAAAFLFSMLLGGALGLWTGRNPRADALFDPLIVLTLNLPLLVVIVLAYIWIGLNEFAAVAAVTIAKTPTIAITVREGARALDAACDEMARVFAIPAWRRFTHVLLPQLLPYLAAAGRAGLSITWKIVLVVELLGRPNGVGYALNLAFQNFNVTAILAYGLLFAAVMLAIEITFLQPFERSARAWRNGA